MFYFETLFNQGAAGIEGSSILATVTGVAYAILLAGFLLGLYQAAMRGGDLQSLGVTAIRYIVIAVILANWTTVFRGVNTSFTQVAHAIYSSSSAGDVFLSWLKQLQQQFEADGTTTFLHAITNSGSALITMVLVLIAYIIYVVAIVVFGFFYTLYGCLLYALGPLVLAFMSMPGVGPLAKTFATNVFIWNGWGLLYAIFAALITAIQVNRVNDLFTFLGFFRGSVDSLELGVISIFYALALLVIPFIAKQIISGDVGSSAYSLVRTAAVAIGAAVSAGAGFAAGSGAGSGAGSAATSSAGGGSSAGMSVATTSANAPPQPSVAQSIRGGISSALNGEPPRPSQSSDSGSGGSAATKSSSGSGNRAGGQSSSPQNSGFRPAGVTQQLAYQAGRVAGSAFKGGGSQASSQESNTNGKEL
ncbi:MAG TPA: hypothetical protein VFK06_14260 [Candidatus Angelobacter sp.]|nr:hypothetical protein [Candidatus Angelobacter sp.]